MSDAVTQDECRLRVAHEAQVAKLVSANVQMQVDALTDKADRALDASSKCMSSEESLQMLQTMQYQFTNTELRPLIDAAIGREFELAEAKKTATKAEELKKRTVGGIITSQAGIQAIVLVGVLIGTWYGLKTTVDYQARELKTQKAQIVELQRNTKDLTERYTSSITHINSEIGKLKQ